MSMSHGDFDHDYLEAAGPGPEQHRPRLRSAAFAGHFDSLMLGRRGQEPPTSEADLDPAAGASWQFTSGWRPSMACAMTWLTT